MIFDFSKFAKKSWGQVYVIKIAISPCHPRRAVGNWGEGVRSYAREGRQAYSIGYSNFQPASCHSVWNLGHFAPGRADLAENFSGPDRADLVQKFLRAGPGRLGPKIPPGRADLGRKFSRAGPGRLGPKILPGRAGPIPKKQVWRNDPQISEKHLKLVTKPPKDVFISSVEEAK